MAGVMPGLLIGTVQMGLIYFQAKRRHFAVEERVPLRELARIAREALPALTNYEEHVTALDRGEASALRFRVDG